MRLSTSASNRSSGNRASPTPRSSSPTTILTETLRKNPFRPPKAASTEEDADIKALNKDLQILADFFPDVKIDVFREVLKRFDGDSRLPICTEQLYKYKVEWARGRLQVPPRDQGEAIPVQDQFRSTSYIIAMSKALAAEFRSLSKSALSTVPAEVNNSYTKARPILQDIASKSRWNYFASVLGFRKKKDAEDAPTVLFEKSSANVSKPRLLPTGSAELDRELEALFIHPLYRRQSYDQESADHAYALKLNEEEAQAAEALFECQVCYNDVPFESTSTCTSEAHPVCLGCVRRTLHEAIFGQGWAKSVDPAMGTLKCLAPVEDECHGHIPEPLVRKAVLDEESGTQAWAKFEDRLVDESLNRSCLPIVRCPFCSYAEADHIYSASSARSLPWRFRSPAVSTLTLILLLELIPALIFFLLPVIIFFPSYLTVFYTSLAHLSHRQRNIRFHCLNPSCRRRSCLTCSKAWHDPHICHEPLITSLRTSVEAARTSAVKRTCPRCGTSFVKSSGCNKLTCVCGYSMCYICRQNIGKAGAAGNHEGAEGYRHFCEHFRPNPGQKCTECNKCDLYKNEDEDEKVRRAGEEAEREWREREGMVGVKGLERAVGRIGGDKSLWIRFMEGELGLQELVDWGVERCVVLHER